MKKELSPHDRLLSLVKARTEKRAEFNYGIHTADRYVRRFLDEIGLQACYRHMSQTTGKWVSFNDVMVKASRTLSYIAPEMEVKEVVGDAKLPSSVECPKNALMIFRHVLTTSRKDRDGDILRTKGAKIDPKMLLLWQHVHTLPIGKMLAVASHTDHELQVYSCIVDMNELCHDAAVMIDNGMGRFSHGFRALDFVEVKDDESKEGEGSGGGFDVKEFEILEESLVSVPANPDAETEEIVLSLVDGGKLTSPLMKDYGEAIRKKRPLTVPVKLDVKILVNDQEVKSHVEKQASEAKGGKEGDREAGSGAPEKAQAVSNKGQEEGTKESTKAGEVKAAKVKLNRRGFANARLLISSGKVKESGRWSGPSADAENAYIEEHGYDEYAKWFLAVRPEADPETKAAYAYPFTSDFENVDRAGLVAIRVRSAQQGEDDVFEAAGKLIEMIDEQEEKEAERRTANYRPEGQKPYPNEHAYRVNDPEKYERIRRVNDKFGSGIHVIFGITEDGKTEIQAIRFSADKFTAEEARRWLEEHGYDPDKLEPAESVGKQLIDRSVSDGTNAVPSEQDCARGVEGMVCPQCDYVGPSKGGRCPMCGAKLLPRKDFVLEKLGRVLSKANEEKIRDAVYDLDEIVKMEGLPRACKALASHAKSCLDEVLTSLGDNEGIGKNELQQTDVEHALAVLLAKGGDREFALVSSLIKVLEESHRRNELVSQYTELFN